ncbi:MAG TPA: fructose-bisphosphatase class III [Spirochaetes bacterium]|nr:fructose-bisphosphatase class III [Spirochaetota bacterium]
MLSTAPTPLKNITSLNDIIRELTEIDLKLESNIETTMWISDPHGAGERFVSILKGRFGLVWRVCYEALPKTFSSEKIEYLGRIIRKEKYFPSEIYTMERQDVIAALVKVARYRIQNISDFDTIRDSIPRDLKMIMENLILVYPVPNIVFENNIIADRLITALCKVIKHVILGNLIVLGDIFDRGDEPDKIVRILNHRDIRPYVRFVWGNHDILWMGAAAGNRSMIAEALRISFRYDNIDFLGRLGIDCSNLIAFAERLYPDDVKGNFKAKKELSRKLEKTLAIIQFKLEEQTIRDYPGFGMASRLWLERLAEMLKAGDTGGLTDTCFPTLSLENPTALTPEESDIMDDLVRRFTGSPKLKTLMRFFFEHGKMYHINNFILNIHALIPSTADGRFEEFEGRRGKELFDYLENLIKHVGQRYLKGEAQDPRELAVMFYLWCGPRSPFFGKNAMKTFERYFLADKAEHKEKLLYWGENIKKKEFMDMIMEEFGVRRIVYGHTPVDINKGEKLASPDGRAINVDGGFSDAYLNRGHSLIHTPQSLYAIILPTPEEIREARTKKEPVKLMIEPIDEFDPPLKVKDTYTGRRLMERREQLYGMLMEYENGHREESR